MPLIINGDTVKHVTFAGDTTKKVYVGNDLVFNTELLWYNEGTWDGGGSVNRTGNIGTAHNDSDAFWMEYLQYGSSNKARFLSSESVDATPFTNLDITYQGRCQNTGGWQWMDIWTDQAANRPTIGFVPIESTDYLVNIIPNITSQSGSSWGTPVTYTFDISSINQPIRFQARMGAWYTMPQIRVKKIRLY